MNYELTIRTPDAITVRTIAAEPGDLAQAVHRHVRGLLGSSRVDIRLDPDTLTGAISNHGAWAGTFALVGRTATAPQLRDPMHGFTRRDIDHMARAACLADRSHSSDMTTRYDTAWSAIALALCEADEPPTRADLVRTGWQAIYADVKAMNRLYGVDSTNRAGEAASAPRFVTYWTHIPHDSASESLIERIAVWEILATLWDVEHDAVQALADHDDYQAAADSLGIAYKALIRNLNAGRTRFRRRWYAPDSSPTIRHTDRRVGAYDRALPTHCAAGHEWTDENTRWDRGHTAGSAKVRRCRACERERAQQRRAAA